MSHEALERLQSADKASRYRFSVVAGELLVRILKGSPEVLLAVVAGGPDEFVRVSAEHYASQDFKREDLLRIYERVRREAMGLQPRGGPSNG